MANLLCKSDHDGFTHCMKEELGALVQQSRIYAYAHGSSSANNGEVASGSGSVSISITPEGQTSVTIAAEGDVVSTSYVRADEYWTRSQQVFAFHTSTWTKYLNVGDMCDVSDSRCIDDLECTKGFCRQKVGPLPTRLPGGDNGAGTGGKGVGGDRDYAQGYNQGDICTTLGASCGEFNTCQEINKGGPYYCSSSSTSI